MVTTFPLGPTITYVTDPALSMAGHKRVLREVIEAAHGFMVRVAFRLPEAPDGEFYPLVEWYWNEEATSNPMSGLRSPLIHYRPDLPKSFEETQIWLPSRFPGATLHAAAFSVHNRQEIELAIESGADEVIFGHVFNTESHPGEAGRGITGLLEARGGIVDEPGITFTAIGGINERSMYALGEVEIMSVACIRAISRSPDIAKTLWSMHQEWNRGLTASLEKGDQQ
jgi:hypothetical protein